LVPREVDGGEQLGADKERGGGMFGGFGHGALLLRFAAVREGEDVGGCASASGVGGVGVVAPCHWSRRGRKCGSQSGAGGGSGAHRGRWGREDGRRGNRERVLGRTGADRIQDDARANKGLILAAELRPSVLQ
jgi:hypothetical protein